MRILILGLMFALIACGTPPQPESKAKPDETQIQSSQESPAVQEEGTSTSQPGASASVPGTAPTASSPTVMNTADLEPQVDAIFAQNPKLSPEQAQGMSGTTKDLIKASHAGDQKAVSSLSSKLLNQALLGGQGFGLVDAAGLASAIQDLVDAAIDADVDGILDAVDDIVAAVTA